MTFTYKLSNRLALLRDAALVTLVTLGACELPSRPVSPTPPDMPSQLVVTPAAESLAVGATAQFAATPRDATGTALSGLVVTWSSGNASVATVNSNGLVTGVLAGSAAITATSEGVSGTAAVTVTAPTPPPPPPPGGALPVFPGAEGYGTMTTAGRGGQVIRVTNLNDAGPGSLRAAIQTPGTRTIIFDVSGQITLQSSLCVDSGCNPDPSGTLGHLTIAGQTAPSPGITLRVAGSGDNLGLLIKTTDVLVQHIRIRAETSSFRRSCIETGSGAARVVFDHVSAAWGASGSGLNFGVLGADVTFSAFINAEASPYGMLIREHTTRISMLRGLFAHNSDRNPQSKGGVHDTWVNNLIYNPGTSGRWFFGIWASPVNEPPQEGPNLINYIGNVAKVGPNSDPGLTIWLQQLVSGSQIYLNDNILLGTPQIEGPAVQVGSPPFALPSPLTILPSSQAEAHVLAHVGARPADRDAVDVRIVSDVMNRTRNNLKGVFPTLAQVTRVLAIPADHATVRPSGYTVLEEDILFPLARAVEGLP